MDERIECFKIESKTLYLEQVLVDYNDIPIFFLCKDEKDYYIVLCTDIEDSCYIIAEPSNIDVYQLLHGKFPMRNVITKQKSFWEVRSMENVEEYIVEYKEINEIDLSVLPTENACFKILTDDISAYVEKSSFFVDCATRNNLCSIATIQY